MPSRREAVPVERLREMAEEAQRGAHPKNRADVFVTVRASELIELCESLAYWKEQALRSEEGA